MSAISLTWLCLNVRLLINLRKLIKITHAGINPGIYIYMATDAKLWMTNFINVGVILLSTQINIWEMLTQPKDIVGSDILPKLILYMHRYTTRLLYILQYILIMVHLLN